MGMKCDILFIGKKIANNKFCNICAMGGGFDGECHDIGAYDYRTCKSCQETESKIYNDIFICFKNSAQNQNGGFKE